MKLQDFKDSLGIPNEGVHKTRFHSYALNDIYATLGLAVICCLILGLPWYFYLGLSKLDFKEKVKYWGTLFIFSIIVMFIYGIVMHRLFYVNSTLNKQIFGTV